MRCNSQCNFVRFVLYNNVYLHGRGLRSTAALLAVVPALVAWWATAGVFLLAVSRALGAVLAERSWRFGETCSAGPTDCERAIVVVVVVIQFIMIIVVCFFWYSFFFFFWWNLWYRGIFYFIVISKWELRNWLYFVLNFWYIYIFFVLGVEFEFLWFDGHGECVLVVFVIKTHAHIDLQLLILYTYVLKYRQQSRESRDVVISVI